MRNDDRKKPRSWRCHVDCVDYAIRKEKARGYRCRRHCHPMGEMLYVDYGRAVINTAQAAMRLEPGDCFIIEPNQVHGISGEQGAPFDFLNVVFRGNLPGHLTGRVFPLSDGERKMLGLLKTEGESRALHFEAVMRHCLNTFFLLLDRRLRNAVPASPISPDNRLRYRSQVVNQVLEALETSFTRPLDPDALARYAGVSSSHLRYLMKRETNMTLRQHLRRLRIDAAKRMLHESPANVDEIAWRVGYRSVPHFCTIFKRETRMTPMAYARSLT